MLNGANEVVFAKSGAGEYTISIFQVVTIALGSTLATLQSDLTGITSDVGKSYAQAVRDMVLGVLRLDGPGPLFERSLRLAYPIEADAISATDTAQGRKLGPTPA